MTDSRSKPTASTEAWRAAIAAWSPSAAGELDRVGVAQIDVDDLLHSEPPQAVRAALLCMNIAVTDLTWSGKPPEGLVVVPLAPRKRHTGRRPDLSDILDQPWRYGPGRTVPGIYLLTQAAWAAYEPVEEYRIDLGSVGLDDDHVAYYRAWRRTSADGEFERAVYMRHVRH